MNKQFWMFSLIAMLYLGVGTANAIPTLQLDIEGGYYDPDHEDMVSESPVFNLYAYGNPNGTTGGGGNVTTAEMLANTYYLSIALTPTVETDLDLGSIVVNGDTYAATSDFTFGTPPAGDGNPDLTHGGYFDTYYLELAFQFDPAMTASLVNTETDGGSAPDASGSDMFYVPFAIDMSALAHGYNLHFDLYTTTVSSTGEIIRGDFAPYSHDASTNVPEPASLILFSMGLLGLGAISRRKRLN